MAAMNFEPKNFFIGVIDFFSVLLPGAVLTYVLAVDPQTKVLGEHYKELTDGAAGWLAFFFSSYVLGHFIFLIGALLLDDFFYDPIREATRGKEIERLAEGGAASPAWRRFLAQYLIKKDADDAQRRVIKIRDHYMQPLGPRTGLNAFQWCRARLVLENQGEAFERVLRFEADSKFFRSFAVVIFILVILLGLRITEHKYLIALAGIFCLALSLWRFVDQRLKSVNQAYWYVLALEAAAANGYRADKSDHKPVPSRAGGIVYRPKRLFRAKAKYLIVEAKDAPHDWVLPKGHIEPDETMMQTAVREVVEETGILARIDRPLGIISFELKSEKVTVQFYLMKALGHGKPQESRRTQWLPLDDAIKTVTHEESRALLRLAEETLQSQ